VRIRAPGQRNDSPPQVEKMKYQEPSPEEYLNIAEKVRSGEYFRESKSMYDISVNDPMSERYFYVFVTALALLTFMTALYAMQSLYPLSRSVPFVYALNDVLEDVPSISPLKSNPHQSVDEAVLFFLAKTFVVNYESYSIGILERNYSAVQHYATPEVFAAYQAMLSTGNPESPIVKYQRHSVRNIYPVSQRVLESPPNTMQVIFNASVDNGEGSSQRNRFRATIGYTYSGVEFNSETGTVKPIDFKVTSYSSKIIQE
jgi:type IV secretory pathway component VirB8